MGTADKLVTINDTFGCKVGVQVRAPPVRRAYRPVCCSPQDEFTVTNCYWVNATQRQVISTRNLHPILVAVAPCMGIHDVHCRAARRAADWSNPRRQGDPMAVESTMLPLGTPAPHFSLETPTSELVTLDQLTGQRALLVMFLCNHCPYVQHVAEALGVHTARWADLGVAAVGIMSNDIDAYPDDAPEHMATFAVANNWSFPYLHDADQSVARAYHAACTPDFFLFDADQALFYRGRLDASRPGTDQPVTAEDLDAAIEAVLAGGAPPEPQLASIGCSIKWRPGTEPPWAQ